MHKHSLELLLNKKSGISRKLKSSGLLFVKESYKLPDIPTAVGKDLECEILVIRNILNIAAEEGGETITVGFVLTSKEEYSTKTTNIDPEEMNGLITAIQYIQATSDEIISSPAIPKEDELELTITASSAEIHYRTMEGMILAAFKSKGDLKYGIKLSSLSDWILLKNNGTSKGIDVFLENLKIARGIAWRLIYN